MKFILWTFLRVIKIFQNLNFHACWTHYCIKYWVFKWKKNTYSPFKRRVRLGEGGIWGRGSSRRDWVKREGKGGWRDAGKENRRRRAGEEYRVDGMRGCFVWNRAKQVKIYICIYLWIYTQKAKLHFHTCFLPSAYIHMYVHTYARIKMLFNNILK